MKIPVLYFGSRRRGKLDNKTTFFDGKFEDLEKFVPVALTRRIVASKFAGILDILGKFVLVLIGLKLNLTLFPRGRVSNGNDYCVLT